MSNFLEFNNISKSYNTKNGEIFALNNISFKVKEGEIISIVGPSGCGKSTILSIISNLDKDYIGNIIKKDNLRFAYMLQSDALLPYLTIYDNALIGLKVKKELNKDNIEYVNKLLKLYNLDEFKDNYPNNLSGGMRQRLALIRTLALNPDILLLDEPFSQLDSQTRLVISNDVHKIIKETNKTAILVTHSIEEAITFSDRVIVLSKRPAIVNKEIVINIPDGTINERRKHDNYIKYFDEIWKELDINES